MKIIKYKIWLLLTLLIFVGQGLAAPFVDCQMKMENSQHQPSTQPMQHDMATMNGTMADMQMDNGMNMPCCGDKCDCSVGLCASFTINSSITLDLQMIPIESHSVSLIRFSLTQSNSNIFHPPILS